MNASEHPNQIVDQSTKTKLACHTFLSLSDDLFCMITPDGYFQQLNPAWKKLLGWTNSELRSHYAIDFVHPDDQQLTRKILKQCSLQKFLEFENRYRHKDGSYRWLFWKVSQRKDGVLYGIAKDITANKENTLSFQQTEVALQKMMSELENRNEQLQAEIAERQQVEVALRESEARYRAIVEDQTELICRFKADGTLTFVNNAYCRYFNKQPSKLIGQSFMLLIPEEDQELVNKNISSLSQAQPILTQEHRVILPSGEIRWQQWTNRGVMFDQSGKITEFQSVGRDITQSKQAEVEICKALAKERELSELRANFVSLVSHEYRTPLTLIQSSAELLQHYYHIFSDEKKQAHLIRIQNAVNRMTQLLEDVLLIGTADAGKLKFEPGPVDLVTFCKEIVETLQFSALQAQIVTQVRICDCTKACMDEKLLGHIFTNLFSNAIKYSLPGGTIKFELICNQETAVFRIQDHGIGIPEQDLPQLFESFGRASNVGTIPGTGLGLAIVKKCVDLHGGKITVESELGVGTTFTVTLPLNNLYNHKSG
jgi:PAS domain S-box-containing protein